MENDFPILPVANHVITTKPKFKDHDVHDGIAIPQTFVLRVQTCEVVSIGEIIDKDEMPFGSDIQIGDKVLVNTDDVGVITLLLKGEWYYIVKGKDLLAKVTEE